jgi:hypothetical protein
VRVQHVADPLCASLTPRFFKLSGARATTAYAGARGELVDDFEAMDVAENHAVRERANFLGPSPCLMGAVFFMFL